MDQITISCCTPTDATEVAALVEHNLLADLAHSQPQAVNRSLVLAARDGAGRLVGGATGGTSYGWLLIKTIWVAPAQRGQGTGRALIARLEAAGRAVGCHRSWLDTSSEMAHEFYQGLGYEDFGVLDNTGDARPLGHRRWFMRRALGQGSDAQSA